MTNIKMI